MYYETFKGLCEERGVRPSDVSKATGISTATLTNWKQGKYTPKEDKMKLIADYFGVTTKYLRTGKQSDRFPFDATAFLNSIKTAELEKPKPESSFIELFSKLTTKDQDEVLRIMAMKLEMYREKEDQRFA